MSDTSSEVNISAVMATPTPNSAGTSNRDRITVRTNRKTSSAPVPAVEIETRAVHRLIRDDDDKVCSVAEMGDMMLSNGPRQHPMNSAGDGRTA